MKAMKQSIVALDLEGVLTPEIWIAVAEKTGIPELLSTTRDISDYDALMEMRLNLLGRRGLGLSDIQRVIGALSPLNGAVGFLRSLRERVPVVVLSDTFEEFAQPLLRQLDWPALWCHRLEVANDRIVGYRLRIDDAKRRAAAALQGLNYRVVAVGDSFNDAGMLVQADHGIFFRPPLKVRERFPQFETAVEYAELLACIERAL